MQLRKKPQHHIATGDSDKVGTSLKPPSFLTRTRSSNNKSGGSSCNTNHLLDKSSNRMPLSKRFTFRPTSKNLAGDAQNIESSEQSISSLDQTSLSSGEDADESDPLLALFRVHNTNRVKFNLTPQPQYTPNRDVEENEQIKRESKNGFSIKKFVSSSLFPSSSSVLHKDTQLNLDDPEDDIIKKLLDPPSPLLGRVASIGRVGSFLSRSRSDNFTYASMKNIDLPNQWNNTNNNDIDEGSNNNKPSPQSKELITHHLRKARRYHKKSHRYRLAMKYYLLTLKEMQIAGYDDTDPLPTQVLRNLNDVHHAQSTLTNSANIVKMGIVHEDRNQLVKALKLYTIAYRMRRDVLGVDHPSLPVLLNMMGSVQVKRGEYSEAMQIYQLGLKGRPDENKGEGRRSSFRNRNSLTTSVTLRDMGMILEHTGEEEKALRFYHASLRYAVLFRGVREETLSKIACEHVDDGEGEGMDDSMHEGNGLSNKDVSGEESADQFLANINCHVDEPFSFSEVRMVKCSSMDKHSTTTKSKQGSKSKEPVDTADVESGEMELFLEKRFDRWALAQDTTADKETTKFYYDDLFLGEPPKVPPQKAAIEQDALGQNGGRGADVDIAMTLHQIGQIHRRSHRHAAALSAYNASLRGMKLVFGSEHAHIAAILGNIGNLYMETGDNDKAFEIYQEVLGIETLHLGLSHPEVAVTLHNIATIECSRGNYSEGVSLYKQVAEMQKIRFGQDHLTVAITLGCLADAYERMGDIERAIKTYSEALKIRTFSLTKYHIDVGRLLHKLGRLAATQKNYTTAMDHVKQAMEVYAINVLPQDHLFMREMARDYADIQAGLAFEGKWTSYVNDDIDTVCDCK